MSKYNLNPDKIRKKVCRLSIDMILEKRKGSQFCVQTLEAQLEGYIDGLIEILGINQVKEILS